MKQLNVKLISILLAIIFLIISCSSIFNIYTNSNQVNRYSAYADSIALTSTDKIETIAYSTKETSTMETVNGVPSYRQISGLSNACGATSGAIVVGFYDKYYEDLIPGFKTYLSSGKYRGNDKTYIPKLINQLYTLMRTNIDDVGVSKDDCLNGLNSYVQDKKHKISFSSLSSTGKLNTTLYIKEIKNNHPVILFCRKINVIKITNGDKSDKYQVYSINNGHIAVAYGIYTVKYYKNNTAFRTDRFLMVALGLSSYPTGYINLNDPNWLNYAYSVNIS